MNLVDEDGYFIEGGGFDSSYNGVATSLGFQLAMVGFEDSLGSISNKAIQWQAGRIKPDGEVSTKGNSRVSPQSKERFLGRKKEVDAGHTVEAFLFAALYLQQNEYNKLARNVLRYYLQSTLK